jgi:hypothetical protein
MPTAGAGADAVQNALRSARAARAAAFRPFLGKRRRKAQQFTVPAQIASQCAAKMKLRASSPVRSACERTTSREAVTFSCGHRRRGPPGWRAAELSGRAMNFVKQRGDSDKPAAEVESNIRELVRRDTTALRQAESDSELAANNLGSLLRRVSAQSTREIDLLIGELRTLREKLATDGSRVEREIVDYAALSQSVIQLTKIIADGVTQVKKVPDAPSISE